MIEREIVKEKLKEFQIQEYIHSQMSGADFSHAIIKKTPLGDKIIIYAAKPGMVVGRKGENIRNLTQNLKNKFKLENPQVEIAEIDNIYIDANVIAERIVSSLERFGSMRFKQIGHKMLDAVIRAGALGIEIKLSGKIPSARARSWRFYQGYLKKSGEAAEVGVKKAITSANLKSGVVGVVVKIMPPDIKLPDHIELLSEPITEEGPVEEVEEKKEKKKRGRKKKTEKEKETVKKKKTKKSKAEKEEKPEEPKAKQEVKTEEKKEEKPEGKPEKPEEESKTEKQEPESSKQETVN
ncbi:30S ribosomal protein S3 [Candidatus Woesearchaeota archaeon]|nr:30S ribosomal protein S3 [Candidatus Woesearchaeota archaeon]